MSKIVTSIGDIDCCILGVEADRGRGRMVFPSLDEMMGISGPDDDANYIDDPANPTPLVSDFDPVFVPNTAPALAIPDPGPGGSLTPKAAGWARGDGTYIVQYGDTLSGLSRLYLGDAGRYMEIWNLQSAAYRALRGSPDIIKELDVLTMPNEAVLKAQQMGVFVPKVSGAGASSAPAAPIASTTPKPAAATPPAHKVGLGLASAAVAGLGLFLWPKPKGKAQRPSKRRPAKRRRR